MKTTLVKKTDSQKKWFVIDATNQVLGRLAVQIANILRGRNKATYTPHQDTGDYVVVINADKVRVTGNKENGKSYMFVTGYMGNEQHITLKDMRKKNPQFLVENAVKGMLPKNRLAREMIKKLKVYAGSEHPHEAQNPITL